jgi:AbrB family looped-hinge helix DNA binding protein
VRSTIDSAGRIVVPKRLRERLGLARGAAVELRERNGRLEVEPVLARMALARRRGGRVAVPAKKLVPLTDEIVRDTIDRVRR